MKTVPYVGEVEISKKIENFGGPTERVLKGLEKGKPRKTRPGAKIRKNTISEINLRRGGMESQPAAETPVTVRMLPRITVV